MINYLEQEQIINSPFISINEFMKLIPVCESRAKQEFKTIIEEMKLNNEFYFETRPRLIPTRKVVEKYDIDVNVIRKEAKRIKEMKL
jgi:hypothetical protein